MKQQSNSGENLNRDNPEVLPDTDSQTQAESVPSEPVTPDESAPTNGVDRPADFALPFVKQKKKKKSGLSHSSSSESSSAGASDDVVLPVTKHSHHSESPDSPVAAEQADFIYTHYHGKKSLHYGSHNSDHVYSAADEPVPSNSHSKHHHRRHHRNKFRRRPWWQKLLIILGWVLGVIVALLVIAAVVLLILNAVGKAQLIDNKDFDMTAPYIDGADVAVGDSGRTISYNGKTYSFNNDMTSVLCIGVDKHELGTEDDIVGTGGQGDALYLIAFNTATGNVKVIGVSRDIVTDIGIYSSTGVYLETKKLQLCLAYAYGDGKATSCENTVTAVSRLFYNLPINSYFALDIDAISRLNDAVGGVTVTMPDNSFYDTDLIQHFKGEKVLLLGDNARKYIQHREVSQLDSSVNRMNRQISYLEKYSSRAISMTSSDFSTPLRLFNIVTDYSVTDLNAAKITAFASGVITHNGNVEFTRVPGEITSGGTYAEYIVDEQGLLELILDTYYVAR